MNLKTSAAPVDAGTAPVASGSAGPPVPAASHLGGDPCLAGVPRAPSQAAVKRLVWQRDRGQCSNCRSTYALEIDHVQPRAVGGPSTLENTRLLCRACNQRAAIQYFGLVKMAGYLERSP